VFDVWHAYDQVEPFGREWEQTASICSMLSTLTALLSACHGGEAKSFGVVDFMPADSVSWLRKKRPKARKPKGVTNPKLQELAIKRAFGF
jgi:hypothetical protein